MDDALLNRFSTRVRNDPAFLGYAFVRHVELNGPTADAVRARFGLSQRDFDRLGLRLRPRPDHFEADVRAAADDFGIDLHALAAVVRYVDMLDSHADQPDTIRLPTPGDQAGFLAAARERKTPRRESHDPPRNRPGES